MLDEVLHDIRMAESAANNKPNIHSQAVPTYRHPLPRPSERKKPAVSAKKKDFNDPQTQLAWLQETVPGHFTLQLVGARDKKSLTAFMAQNGVKPPYAIFARNLTGAPWYSLVAGHYRTRQAAVNARDKLPWRLKAGGVWPRTFGSIQEIIKQP